MLEIHIWKSKGKAIMGFLNQPRGNNFTQRIDKQFYSHVNKPQLSANLILKIDPHLL